MLADFQKQKDAMLRDAGSSYEAQFQEVCVLDLSCLKW